MKMSMDEGKHVINNRWQVNYKHLNSIDTRIHAWSTGETWNTLLNEVDVITLWKNEMKEQGREVELVQLIHDYRTRTIKKF